MSNEMAGDTPREFQKRTIHTGGGNYNERIEGHYVQNNYYADGVSPEREKTVPEICKNRESLKEYLDIAVTNLKQKLGFLNFEYDVYDGELPVRLVAKKLNLDTSIGFLPARGEAFVIFSEFEQISSISLTEFSTQCLRYAKSKAKISNVGKVIYDFKIPSNLCFCLALVDKVREETKVTIKRTNPLKHSVDAIWYEIPIVYELSSKQLYFYEKPYHWTDYFTGEIAWNGIRKIIQDIFVI